MKQPAAAPFLKTVKPHLDAKMCGETQLVFFFYNDFLFLQTFSEFPNTLEVTGLSWRAQLDMLEADTSYLELLTNILFSRFQYYQR